MATSSVLTLLSVLAYVAAAGVLAWSLVRQHTNMRITGLALGVLAVALHAIVMLGLHRHGLNLHFFAALSLVGVGVAATTLIVNLFRPVAGLGVLVFPLAAVLLAIDVFIAPPTAGEPMDWQIKLHVMIALVAYSVLSIAALLAVLLTLQERALRLRRVDSGLIRALPPLTLTEALMFRLIGVGFVLLSLTLITGALFVDNLFAQHLVHKTILSIVAWLVFGILLFGRRRWGWRGGRAVNLTLAGMAVLLLAFFGSKFVLELVLKRGA